MKGLAVQGLLVDLQVLDNEISTAYKEAITFEFKLVLPDMHHSNQAEQAICTFKDHIMAILVGVNAAFPLYL
jgi:hypothetical protein